MYGNVNSKIQDEQTSFNPISPYAISKLHAHWMLGLYRNAYNLYCCSGILFNHDSPLRGNDFVTKKIVSDLIKVKFKIIPCIHLGNIYAKRDWGYPVDFSGKSKESKMLNIQTAKKAKEYLIDNGVIIMFPSGGVSTAVSLKSNAIDDEWKLFPAKLIHQTKTDVLPIYFDGKNGFLFHLFASKFKNQTLKYSSYIHETKKMIGKEINIYSKDLIKYEEISNIKDRSELTNFLKETTYNLKNKA